MKAWLSRTQGGTLEAVEILTPDPVGSEVAVAVTHCGVCHSDLLSWKGVVDLGSRGLFRKPPADHPIAMGHEIVGRVAALGPDAEGIAVGDQVIVYPWLGCGQCEDCLGGNDNVCMVEKRSLGSDRHGGFAGQVMVPHPRYLVATGDINPALAATYACSGLTVRSAIRKVMPPDPDQPVVVIGAGGLGLQAVAVLRALGHRKILVVDAAASRRDLALHEGASDFAHIDGESAPDTLIVAAGGKVPAILDFVNNAQTASMSFDSLRKGGRMVQVGLYGGDLVVPLYLLAAQGLTVQGSITGTLDDLKDVVRLAREGSLKPVPIEIVPKAEVNHAIERLSKGDVRGRLVLHEAWEPAG